MKKTRKDTVTVEQDTPIIFRPSEMAIRKTPSAQLELFEDEPVPFRPTAKATVRKRHSQEPRR